MTTLHRWYGRIGNRRKEVLTRCVVYVVPDGLAGIGQGHQCTRDRGHGEGGMYCRQHAKVGGYVPQLTRKDGTGGEGPQ